MTDDPEPAAWAPPNREPTDWGPPSLIASDVDGTLLDRADTLTPRTRAVLERARAEGVELVLATGRPPRWIPQVADQLADSSAAVRYAVCANGAIVYDVLADEILHVEALETEVLRELAEAVAERLPGVGLAVERAATLADSGAGDAATAPFVATAGYQHAWLNPDHVEVNDEQIFAVPAVKMLVRDTSMTSRDMAHRLRPALGDLAEVTFSIDTGLVEISVPRVHKARGLAWLAEHTDVDARATIAFGDMPNDIEMLRWAGLGVAMGHGDPAATAVADQVAPSNAEDGLAQVLEHWF
ncbi:MAG: HAD family hydrolase [Gordonia sp. (in: high G+C Gram-positive bacteria)]|uniref:HAD family hydrolase n=1 Tax=Gordonia sp. (in: high G+C Gram-positive bacteria) TaxID=84139 RepID=UPI0039E718B0